MRSSLLVACAVSALLLLTSASVLADTRDTKLPRSRTTEHNASSAVWVGGLAGAGVALLGGLSLAYGASLRCDRYENQGDLEGASNCRLGSGLIYGLSTLIALPIFVTEGAFIGGMIAGDGAYGGALLGSLLGLLPGATAFVLGYSANRGHWDDPTYYNVTSVVLTPVGFVVGAIVGYHWSADAINGSINVAPDGSGAKLTIGGTF